MSEHSDFSIVIHKDRNSFELNFSNSSLCDAVGRLEFCSRLLYELRPDDNAIWKSAEKPRINACIVGFPNYIKWERPSKNILKGITDRVLLDEYFVVLKNAISSIKGEKDSFNSSKYLFAIQYDNQIYNYDFDNRSRAIVAFCILWDGENHPRDHLELRRLPSVPFLAEYPNSSLKVTNYIKTYGDPSKTVDELRNQGFPRETDQSKNGIYLKITRANRYDTLQEHYQLVNRVQSKNDQVGRSQISRKHKLDLYKSTDYACNNCGESFPFDYLAPDHRVPSIIQKDNLTNENFMDVLQTLCVRCNQVKREACKKCPYEHQCELCSWAYPEKFSISKQNLENLRLYSKQKSISINELIQKFLDYLNNIEK